MLAVKLSEEEFAGEDSKKSELYKASVLFAVVEDGLEDREIKNRIASYTRQLVDKYGFLDVVNAS